MKQKLYSNWRKQLSQTEISTREMRDEVVWLCQVPDSDQADIDGLKAPVVPYFKKNPNTFRKVLFLLRGNIPFHSAKKKINY